MRTIKLPLTDNGTLLHTLFYVLGINIGAAILNQLLAAFIRTPRSAVAITELVSTINEKHPTITAFFSMSDPTDILEIQAYADDDTATLDCRIEMKAPHRENGILVIPDIVFKLKNRYSSFDAVSLLMEAYRLGLISLSAFAIKIAAIASKNEGEFVPTRQQVKESDIVR